jgi:hypothetical protein
VPLKANSIVLLEGVHITTTTAEPVAILKDIEGMDVEIYSCRACLQYYDLESKPKVGHRGTMNLIVKGRQDIETVV